MATNEVGWCHVYQGKTSHYANCPRDDLLIVSSEKLEGPDIVPRREVELTKEDNEKLRRLNLPPDDASIMSVRISLDSENHSLVKVVRASDSEGMSKKKILKLVEELMKSTRKAGISLYYVGPGKRNTGDWCFEDGFITFQDITELYLAHFMGKLLVIQTDCSHSGCWVKKFVEFLDKQNIQPCGHSAKEKGILIKVRVSCEENEIPFCILNSLRANENDKNKGILGIWGNGWKVAEGQHLRHLDSTKLLCGVKSIQEPCALPSDYTWYKQRASERVYLVRGKDKGRQCWHYVLLVDDDETKRKFHEKVESGTVNVADYGQVIKSGWGKDPPNEVRDEIDKHYDAVYT